MGIVSPPRGLNRNDTVFGSTMKGFFFFFNKWESENLDVPWWKRQKELSYISHDFQLPFWL